VLFDEPLTVIDPVLKWELRSKLKALHRQLDITMIYVTHDQTEALTFADTVVVMHDGAVVQMGTPAELFEKPAHTFVGYFIGSPGMNLIKAEVEGTRAKVGDRIIELGRAYRGLPRTGVELGIRPEFITLGAPGTGQAVSVRRIDDLGARRIARVDFAGNALIATAPEGLMLAGSDAGLIFDRQQIHVYANGARVEGEAA